MLVPNDPYTVLVTCRKCGEPCKRSPISPHGWYHLDDEMDLTTGKEKHDHDAEPNLLDL